MTLSPIQILDVKNKLGEGVLYEHSSDKIWWTDIRQSLLMSYHLSTKNLQYWVPPHPIASFGFTNQKGWLIVAFTHAIGLYNPERNLIKWLHQPDIGFPQIRFNDGKVDHAGRFWVGTMEENPGVNNQAAGKLFSLDSEGELTEKISNIRISNGLCWSPDNSVMYHADSPLQSISAYAFNLHHSRIQSKQDWVNTKANCYPDGSCVDAQGGVWNAQWQGGQVVRYFADGSEDIVITLPVSQPTCAAIGGKDGNLLFVTSASEGLSEDQLTTQPLAGALFIYEIGHRGIVEPVFQLAEPPR